jgi:Acetoacetate decarboxylase (ADC)
VLAGHGPIGGAEFTVVFDATAIMLAVIGCPTKHGLLPPNGGIELQRRPGQNPHTGQVPKNVSGPTHSPGCATMLKAFSVPITPQGKSTLATLPPWHYSGDCIAIEYWADPGATEALLPPGLTPDKKSGGRAFFWFLDWQFTGSNDELTDPSRYQYREAFALVEAVFDGLPVNYCPYIFVDNDAALARGWAQGFPKKLASVYQTRSFSAPSPAAAPLTKGSRFGASVAAHGERLATARIQIEERIDDPSTVFKRPTTMRRYFPQLAAGRQDKPPVDELTMSLTDNLAIVDVWAGSAELRIPEVQGEDMHLIAPLRVGRGYRLGMAYSVTDLRILKNYAG